MRILYILVPIFVIALSSSSCIFSDLFGANNRNTNAADTVVAITNMKHIDVQYVESDTSYSLIAYWTDNSGRPLYMKSRQHFVRQTKHGQEKRWASNGQLVYTALWANGTPVGSELEYYENGALKRRIDYNDAMGYRLYEMNFHENGTPLTDTIVYEKGKKNSAVNYYNEMTGGLHETHVYLRDTLIAIRVHNPKYDKLASQADALARSMKTDSVENERNEIKFAKLLGDLKSGVSTSWSNGENEKDKLDYLESMLKEDKK